MNDKKTIFSFAIIFLNLFIPCLTAGNKFDGNYKSEFLLPFNKSYVGEMKCPSKLPIKVKLRVEDNNITGTISNSSNCPNYQRAQIKGEIDDAGNIVKIKFDHYDKRWGPKDDAYKIEGNLNGELILKSKQKRMYKNHMFFFTYQNPLNRNDEYINESETSNFKNDNESEFSGEAIKKQFKESKEKELKKLKEKELQKLKEKELQKLKEKELQQQERIKKESNLLFD